MHPFLDIFTFLSYIEIFEIEKNPFTTQREKVGGGNEEKYS